MAAELPRQPLCEILKDPDGSRHFIISREALGLGALNKSKVSPQVDVWWNRAAKKVIGGRTYREEVLVLRQETEGAEKADVIQLTLGQMYQMIDALNRAVESR